MLKLVVLFFILISACTSSSPVVADDEAADEEIDLPGDESPRSSQKPDQATDGLWTKFGGISKPSLVLHNPDLQPGAEGL